MTASKRETYTWSVIRLVFPPCVALVAVLTAAALHAQAGRRSLYVSALDRTGAPVDRLDPADIIVREDRVAREVLAVALADEPMQIALLVDNSQAADSFIQDYREAVPAFIRAVAEAPGSRHQMSIVTLADRPTINTEYTSDVAALIKGTQRIFSTSGSGTYLLDGIIEVSRGISKREFTRPVIVAIVTEGPDLSDRAYQSVLEPLRASGAAFHVLVVGSPTNRSHDRQVVLAEGSRTTGGRYDTLLTGTALTSRLKQVAAELTHQFRVTYARPQTLIQPDDLTVAAARPGLVVRGTFVKSPPLRERP